MLIITRHRDRVHLRGMIKIKSSRIIVVKVMVRFVLIFITETTRINRICFKIV